MKYKHYLLTKFNIYYPLNSKKTNQIINPKLRLNLDYLNFRVELFTKYTFPSVINQTNKDFEWLILIDVKTPKTIIEKLEKLVFGKSWIHLFT